MRHAIIAAALATSVLAGPAAWAEDWPRRPITLVLGSAPGGTGDILLRAYASALSRKLGQPVTVDNRAGASGMLGVQVALAAPADGYTYAVGIPSSLIAPQYQYKKLAFDPGNDLVPVSTLAINEMVVVANASVPANDVRGLVRWGEQNRGKLNYASYGEGSYSHWVSNYLSATYDLRATHVPYRAEAPMLMAVAANEAAWGIAAPGGAKKMAETGKVKIIGVLLPERSKIDPSIPTLKEVGLTDDAFAIPGWYGLFAKRGTPPEILARMESALVEIGKDAELRAKFAAAGILMDASGAEVLKQLYVRDLKVYQKLAEKSGVEKQ